jgi:hypothetical protein
MKLDNTEAPMESSTFDVDTQITVCKTLPDFILRDF